MLSASPSPVQLMLQRAAFGEFGDAECYARFNPAECPGGIVPLETDAQRCLRLLSGAPDRENRPEFYARTMAEAAMGTPVARMLILCGAR